MHATYLGTNDPDAHPLRLPLAADSVRAGFPSPADDYIEAELDLVSHLIQHPSATFYVRAQGDSMVQHGIHDGDLLIVDRALEPRDGDILIIAIDGDLTVKKLGTIGKRPYLLPGNPNYAPIPMEGRECHVWGVVTHNVHAHRAGVGK
ncbi:translesion error-prone DNA polymerase V autoproteolytic subunit [Chromohalobacter canadensis]|uniref:LexA family protein n=1 Tax=Chromohalobacter canadensis TaxID=141389 RepID=UPI0021C00B33|nr:translesion error-prone DNA polymerase V autoproteolytic subunit [Chromohalobacter canadensis]MCT8469436.1 translesion error-prone DNA polymerase V autoproteolytic subunit [Chromohalobacter canadensis]MCT8472060.1 translesion error-prone DNA polymerase V autoproteolytic subunit [Chromohalobacter canadensis]MCT8499827.1 translesion error-prone DNA polymerase V autoproteolytic subunit [Chromohalobacter canadensis]